MSPRFLQLSSTQTAKIGCDGESGGTNCVHSIMISLHLRQPSDPKVSDRKDTHLDIVYCGLPDVLAPRTHHPSILQVDRPFFVSIDADQHHCCAWCIHTVQASCMLTTHVRVNREWSCYVQIFHLRRLGGVSSDSVWLNVEFSSNLR
jgi:hypothetical protein